MFLPLYDGVPLAYLKAPLVTRALIGACAAAWLLTGLGLLPVSENRICSVRLLTHTSCGKDASAKAPREIETFER